MVWLLFIFAVICMSISFGLWWVSTQIKICGALSAYFILCATSFVWLVIGYIIPMSISREPLATRDWVACVFLGIQAAAVVLLAFQTWRQDIVRTSALGPHTPKDQG